MESSEIPERNQLSLSCPRQDFPAANDDPLEEQYFQASARKRGSPHTYREMWLTGGVPYRTSQEDGEDDDDEDDDDEEEYLSDGQEDDEVSNAISLRRDRDPA